MSDSAKVQDVVKSGFKAMATAAFLNNGVVEDGKRVKVKDLLTSTDATIFLPKVISSVVKEAVEPVLTISTNLFQTIRINSGRSIEFPAVGALTAEEIPEGSAYPEKQLDMGSGNTVSVAATKVGIMVRITEEMIEDSQWDVIGLHLRAAGRALARKKETLCAQLFSKFGYKIFDNVEPTAAVIGKTTGRDIKGVFNGTLHLDDLFDMIAYLINSGFTPRTILMHPLAWLMLAKNPMLKELAWSQNNNYWGGTYSGNVGQTGWDGKENLRYKTIAPNLSTTQTALPPGIFPVPLRILVSPYVRFLAKGVVAPKQDGTNPGATLVTDANGLALAPLTDIYIVDDPEGGLIVQRDDISTEHFDDPARDIRQMKIRERYGLGILSQGKSVVVARNIAITLSYVFNNMNTATNLATPDRNSI
jgi:hypothetical protein